MKFVSLTIIVLTCISTSLAAQDERRTVRAIRLQPDERIVLDGRLDEAAWSRAVPARDFIQQDPDNGKPATEPTEVRIVFTSTALYMGVTCLRLRAGQVARLPAAPRRVPAVRRPVHVDHRHVPRPADRATSSR